MLYSTLEIQPPHGAFRRAVRAAATLLLLTTVSVPMITIAAEPPPALPAPLTLTGEAITVDDALFTGCQHSAFEGTPLEQPDGSWKAGPQKVQRTKAVLTGGGTGKDVMTLTFRADVPTTEAATLTVVGLNDRHDRVHPVEVTLNGRIIAADLVFPRNLSPTLGLNQRYYMGWAERAVAIPAGLLRTDADNVLTLRNTTNAFTADTWPFVLVDEVRFSFAAERTLTVQPPPAPRFYTGLRDGVEVHLWPVDAYGDSVTLLTGMPLEYNFFATMPRDLPLGTKGSLAKEPTRPVREILLNLWSDVPIVATDLAGAIVAPTADADGAGGRTWQAPLGRLIDFETPHPAQGVRLYLQASAPFTGRRLRAWYSVDGVDYPAREFPLSAVSMAPVDGRETLNFGVSMWGSNVPSEATALKGFTQTLSGLGFNQVFTGDSPELNAALKADGFSVYPRFGWFGHQFTVTDETAQWAAISAKGEAAKKDYCPLAILEHADHPELGKFFARTREFAALANIDGLCVDYETAPVWCWCDRCLAMFREETGHPEATRELCGPQGPLAADYQEFGRRRNRDLLTQVKKEMQGVNPALRYLALGSTNDVPVYWYDPRTARHSMRELTRFADEVFASIYCYEVPGGLKSILPVMRTVRRYALASGREVDASMIAPVAQTVSEFPRYGQASMQPATTRLMVLLTALGGGRSISFFRGDCFDGSQFLAVRQAVTELIAVHPYIDAGYDRSEELLVTPSSATPLRFETGLAQNLLSRFEWRPQTQYYHDHVQLFLHGDGRDRLVALFNYADATQTMALQFSGLMDHDWQLLDALTGEVIATVTRSQLEAGEFTLDVPARDCRLLRLVVAPALADADTEEMENTK